MFCLPDMLWYFALLLSQTLFMSNGCRTSKVIFCIAASIPFMLEFLQYMKIIPGTFDIMDVCVYVFTLIVFVLCWRKRILFS